jgi:hypothetical protein
MALVGSLSGTLETGIVAITGSLIPSATTHNLGSSGFRWGTVYANNITGSIRSTAGGGDFIIAGPNATVNYNSAGQWEITGAAAAASYFVEASLDKIYTTGSAAIGFSAAASSKGSDIFFAVSSSNPAVSSALFSGPVVTSGSITVKDLGNTVATITGPGVISGSALQSAGDLTVQGNSFITGSLTVRGDLEIQGTTVTVSASNLVIEDPLVGFGFLSGGAAPAGIAGDRGFVGGIAGAGNNIAFAWSSANSAFVATRTTSTPNDSTITFSQAQLQPVRASRFQVSGTNALIYSPDGTNLIAGSTATSEISGSLVQLNAATSGVVFLRETSPFLGVLSGSSALSTNQSRIIASTGKSILLGAQGQFAIVSGSQVFALGGNDGFMVQRDGTNMFQINSTDGTTLNLAAQSGFGTVNLVNSVSTAVNIAGAATSVLIGSSVGSTTVNHNLIVSGSSYIGNNSSDVLEVKALVTGSLLPFGDRLTDLGSPSNRWGNIYTGDLHLRNDRGDYTLIEEADFLSIRFNKTGKRYKFVLEPVPELDEK